MPFHFDCPVFAKDLPDYLFEALGSGDVAQVKHALRRAASHKDAEKHLDLFVLASALFFPTKSHHNLGSKKITSSLEDFPVACIRMAAELGANLDRAYYRNVNYHEVTLPLILGINKEVPGLLQALLDAGANINTQDVKSGYSALSFAVEDQYTENIRFFLEKGADPNVGSLPAWMYGISSGYTEHLPLLFEHGADIDATDEKGDSVFHMLAAIDYEDEEDIERHKELLVSFLDKNPALTVNLAGETARDIADRHGNLWISHLLSGYEANMDAARLENKTPSAPRPDRSIRL